MKSSDFSRAYIYLLNRRNPFAKNPPSLHVKIQYQETTLTCISILFERDKKLPILSIKIAWWNITKHLYLMYNVVDF